MQIIDTFLNEVNLFFSPNDKQIKEFIELKHLYQNKLISDLQNIVKEYLHPMYWKISSQWLSPQEWHDHIILENFENKTFEDWSKDKLVKAFNSAFSADDYDLGTTLLIIAKIQKIWMDRFDISNSTIMSEDCQLNLLHQSVYLGKNNFLKAVLESNLFNVNYKAYSNEINVLRGAHPDGFTALHIAAHYLKKNALEQLLQNTSINIHVKDMQGYKPLDRIMMEKDKEQKVECLELFKKANSGNLKNACTGLLLLNACECEQFNLATTLINSGYIDNINYQSDHCGITPLFESIRSNNPRAVLENLINHPDIDVNILCQNNGFKITPLHLAIQQHNREAIFLLISHPKIEIDKEVHLDQEFNVTPLFLAVKMNELQSVQLLLSKPVKFTPSIKYIKSEANTRISTIHSTTPFQMALKNRNYHIYDVLQEAEKKQGDLTQNCLIQ